MSSDLKTMRKQVILTIPDSVDLSALREMKVILHYYKDGNDLYEYSTDMFSLSEAKGDLISRKALLKAFANSEHIKETDSGLDVMEMLAIKEIIENAPTVEYPFYAEAYQTGYEEGKNERPQGEWIPVSEKSPDDREDTYWVCTDGEYQCQCRWTNDNAFWSGLKTDWHWCIFDIPQYHKVIAWQPLPEPYKKGGAE